MMFECIDKVYPSVSIDIVTGAICSFSDNIGNLPLKSCVSQISGYQEGSGTPSPDNVRPLHAFSSGSLGKCDNNTASLWTIDNNFNGDVEFNQLSNNSQAPTSRSGLTITGSSDGFTIDGTATSDITATGWFNLDKIDDEYLSMAGHKVIISLKLLSGTITKAEGATRSLYFGLGGNVRNVYIDGAGYILVSPAITSSSTSSLTIINGTKFENAKIGLNVIDLTAMFGSTIADYIYNLEKTTTGAGVAFFKSLYPEDYYAYNAGTKQLVGDTLATFTFGTSIYQGYIDWKRGVVVGNMLLYDIGSQNWYKSTSGANPFFYRSFTSSPDSNFVSEIYQFYGVVSSSEFGNNAPNNSLGVNSAGGQIFIRNDTYTDPTAFKTAMNGVYLAYELATPIEIPLGGVNLITQQGQNNIFCDTGDTTVEYIKIV